MIRRALSDNLPPFQSLLFKIKYSINGCSLHHHFPASASPLRHLFFKRKGRQRTVVYCRNSSMAPNKEDPRDSRKRKLREVEETPLPSSAPFTTNLFPLRPRQYSPRDHISTALRLDLNRQVWSNSLEQNTTMSMLAPFKSFTALLTEDDDEDSLPPNIKEQNDQIDQIIKFQADHLRRTVADVQRKNYKKLLSAAKERAGKKLKETELALNKVASRNVELQNKEASLTADVLLMKAREKQWEEKVASLRVQLQEAISRAGRPEGVGCTDGQQQEECESSSVDPDRLEPIMLACRRCRKSRATMMLWPCRHLSECTRCEPNTTTCPVCYSTKSGSVHIRLPEGLGLGLQSP